MTNCQCDVSAFDRRTEMAIFYFARHAPKLRYYGDVIHSFYRKSAIEHGGGVKCVIVYLARDIRPFVMYCVNGKPRSSLLIVYRLYDIYI